MRGRKRGTAVRGTAAWDTAMARAHQQAQSYARNLPVEEVRDGRPPFLIIVDVGQSIALYAEFSRSGGNYIPFPDPAHYRISLDDLADPEVRALLAAVWLDPLSLDPARRSARVTREIADRLARLAQSLEPGHAPAEVADFLMRCLFTMFAEDVSLLPKGAFTQLLADSRRNAASFPPLVEELWRTMASGGFSVALRVAVPHFNGGLFEHPAALPLTADQLQLLIEAAQADWRDVEPAIFGTLLVRALDPAERHKLGAHFTPRAYVERLVLPTIIEPLRAEWEAVQTAALLLAEGGKGADALAEVEAFQRRLASVRILDPACGSGNFLYVTLEHLKRLEGEVLEVLRNLGQAQATLELEGEIVRPEQFYGIEVNPWAAAIAELVLWIGYLQWHLRTRGDAAGLPEPILRNLHNIECRDAVLAWDAVEPLLDADGPARDPLGRPHDQDAPGDRRARARRDRARARLALRQPAAGGVAGGRFHRRQPAVHRHGAHARGAGRRLCRGDPPRLSPRAGFGRLRDVLVGQGGRAGADGPGAALRLDHDQQPAPDLQPPRAGTPPGRAGATATSPRVRHPRPSLGGQRRGRGGADRDDGGRGRRGTGGVAAGGQRAAGR